MSTTASATKHRRGWAVFSNRLLYRLTRHWLLWLALLFGVYAGLPWLAPIFMQLGWYRAGNLIYVIYSTQCHQLPQRSFFLFGPKAMYSLAEVQAVWQNTYNPLVLRQFVGNPQMGWKVAWSDRMVSMYTVIPLSALLYGALRKRLRPLPWWGFVLLALPMVVDGGTHMISDLAGIGQGFRYTNAWLAALTGNAFPVSFYAGDALGSFNSWMRLITGVLFGLGTVWFAFPYIEETARDVRREIETKFRRAGLPLA